MSLLTEASLVILPNAVEEGTLFSIIPADGSGDMDVVRATTATLVNSEGVIEDCPYNLLTYSNTFSNASWFKNNTTITTSQAGYDGTNNASLLVENSTAGTHFIGKTPSLSGQITISVYAKANTRNWLYLRGVQAGVPVFGWFNLSDGTLGTIQTNGTGSIESIGNGWYRCSLTIANFNTGFETYIGISTANNTISYLGNESSVFIQNAQVNSGASAKEYFPTTDRLNVPRLDYTNGSCPSILVEPQRTNLALWSEEFDNASWSSSMIRNANATISPSGTMTADLVQVSGGSGVISRAITITNSVHSFSVYAKKGNWDIFRIVNGSSASNVAWFNLTNGTTSNVIGGTSQIIDVGNGWYRCIYNTTTPNTTAGISFVFSSAMGSASAPVNGSNIFLWGAQLEAGSYATSYIPTVASAVTRNADVISKTGIADLIGQTQGTIFLDLYSPFDGTTKEISLSDGTLLNRISIGFLNQVDRFIIQVIKNNVTQVSNTFISVNQDIRNKIVLSYSENNYRLFINGVLSYNDTLAETFTNELSILQLNRGINQNQYFGEINSIQLYKTALTDQQCISMTQL